MPARVCALPHMYVAEKKTITLHLDFHVCRTHSFIRPATPDFVPIPVLSSLRYRCQIWKRL